MSWRSCLGMAMVLQSYAVHLATWGQRSSDRELHVLRQSSVEIVGHRGDGPDRMTIAEWEALLPQNNFAWWYATSIKKSKSRTIKKSFSPRINKELVSYTKKKAKDNIYKNIILMYIYKNNLLYKDIFYLLIYPPPGLVPSWSVRGPMSEEL